MKRLLQIAVCVSLTVYAPFASAHHSTANYDYNRSVELAGTLKKFQWMNPHCFLQVVVTNSRGQQVEWSVESGSPALARRLGWKPEMFTVGQRVKVIVAPIRTGEPNGTLRSITLANGRTLLGPGAQGQAPSDLGLPTLKRAN